MRRKKILTLIGSICLTLVLAGVPFLTACPAPAPEEEAPSPPEEEPVTPAPPKVFKVGTLSMLSGPAAHWGKENVRALNYCIDEVNAEGGILVGGERYKVELVKYDTEYRVDKGVAAANRAIYSEKLKYVHIQGGAIVKACLPMTERNNVLVIANTMANKELCNPDHPLTFFHQLSPAPLGPVVYYPELIKEFGMKKIAVVNPDDETGYMATDLIREVIEKADMPLEIVAEEYFVRGAKDYTPIVLRVLAKEPDMVDTSAGSVHDVGMFLKQLHEAGYTGLTMNSTSLIDPKVLWNVAGEACKGHFILGLYAKPPTPEYARYSERYYEDFGEPPSVVAMYPYETLVYLLQAIEKAGTFDTKVVADVWADMEWDGMFGHWRWCGEEPILGFGINRAPSVPFPMGRVGEGGEPVDWKLKGFGFE